MKNFPSLGSEDMGIVRKKQLKQQQQKDPERVDLWHIIFIPVRKQDFHINGIVLFPFERDKGGGVDDCIQSLYKVLLNICSWMNICECIAFLLQH